MLLLAGCAVGGKVEGTSPEPRTELARTAEIAAANRGQMPAGDHAPDSSLRDAGVGSGGVGSGGKSAGGVETSAPAKGGRGPRQSAATGPGASTTSADWKRLASLDDAVGDHGDGPGYADLTQVRYTERDGLLATTITVASVIPGQLANREVQGVGIDFFRSSSDESDYQVFLDGGVDGWRAFLQTPDGFVEFPGTFAVRGRTFEVAVPWTAIGGREDAKASAFIDWSTGVGRLSTDGTLRSELQPR